MASVASYSETRTAKKVLFACTTDGSGDATGTSKLISGMIDRVVVVPGASVSDKFTILITDETTCDLLDSDSNTGLEITPVTIPKNIPISKVVDSTLTCTIASGGATKSILVYIYYR